MPFTLPSEMVNNSTDRPVEGTPPETEVSGAFPAVEITQEMVAAGVAEYDLLKGSFPNFMLVKQIYTAMAAARLREA